MKLAASFLLGFIGCVASLTIGGFDCTNKPNGLYPNAANCKTFYKCSNHIAYLYDCPSNLDFDSERLICDWPGQAKCAGGDCDKWPGWWNGKDCNGHNHGELYPDPYDCGSFYQCSWGRAYWFNCPSVTHFNNRIKVCDWPQNAGCKEECPPNKTKN